MPRLSLRAAHALSLVLLVIGGTTALLASIVWQAMPPLFDPFVSDSTRVATFLATLGVAGAWFGYAWMIRIAVAAPSDSSWFRSSHPAW
jgi:hypothetical protein